MKSILVIDDQESAIAVLTKILSPDYTVYAADNGTEGIKIAEEYVPDIILLDILMTEMDGFAVFAVLKGSEKTRHIPVIFITSLLDEANEERGLALGAADYITKPFSPAIVKLRVNHQIRMIEQLRTIERLSMLDELTDLPNRRSFEARLSSEWSRATREKTPLSILMIDVDRFKDFNDTYGHIQGDIALQAASKVFSQMLKRPGDFAARWGGEEFIVLLPNTDISGAQEIAEQIRKNIETMLIPCYDGMVRNITVSIGVNVQINKKYITIDDFISGADKALYDAKIKGRNRVCFLEK
ncbi:MAG: diguanylate cyclase [Treponema sp.]|nr:diguanylate cyclase [Treponema sp.]